MVLQCEELKEIIYFDKKEYIFSSKLLKFMNNDAGESLCFALLIIFYNNKRTNCKIFFVIVFANFPRCIWGLWSAKSKNNIIITQFPKCIRCIWGTLVKE